MFNGNELFNTENLILNRDGTLEPFKRLHESLQPRFEVNTADFMQDDMTSNQASYYSLGITKNLKKISTLGHIHPKAFVVMEPPAVAPHLYKLLPKLTRMFDRVYVHNTIGDGYSLNNVVHSKLSTFYWPQPYFGVLEQYWSNTQRAHKIVVINGNHIPRSLKAQLYGKRIEGMANLAKFQAVDLYGRGWNQWWSHRSMWPPYWFNYKTLMSIYKGPCASKYEVLSQYKFSLCFENMAMTGYVTEKIFDCFYAGCVPIYLGAPNIEELIPKECFIDFRQFANWQNLWQFIQQLSENDIQAYRDAAKLFMQSETFLKYYNALEAIIQD